MTVGDSYVAVADIPEAREDHAIVMATCRRFANEVYSANESHLQREFTPILGPETSELSIRVGIHSGPIVAGGGQRSRFQLFGNSINTASRMESTNGESSVV